MRIFPKNLPPGKDGDDVQLGKLASQWSHRKSQLMACPRRYFSFAVYFGLLHECVTSTALLIRCSIQDSADRNSGWSISLLSTDTNMPVSLRCIASSEAAPAGGWCCWMQWSSKTRITSVLLTFRASADIRLFTLETFS